MRFKELKHGISVGKVESNRSSDKLLDGYVVVSPV